MLDRTCFVLALACAGCGGGEPAAVAEVAATEGNAVTGTVRFENEGGGARVFVDVGGLDPNGVHGFHVHENGDCSAPDGTSAGGHFNPDGHDHGLPGAEARHAGDLGNLDADATGEFHGDLFVDTLSVDGALPSVVGRAVIIHAQADDGGQPTGNAGPRLACGVIALDE